MTKTMEKLCGFALAAMVAAAAGADIRISSVEDWTTELGGASLAAETYVLTADLDFGDWLATNDWAGLAVRDFRGKFFGQGHAIRGLVVTNGSTGSTFALFDSVTGGAEIRDLTVVASNVPGDDCTVFIAGLAASVGSGVLVSNCHAVVDWQGVYPSWAVDHAYQTCQYYGLVRTANGSDIRIADCTVKGRLAGGTGACGFIGDATLDGGEIARCAVFADVSAMTNRTGGTACGFAGSITLSGGAVVRECSAAGTVDAARDACGFADSITFRDAASAVRDCYSTAEVVSHNPGHYDSYGIARTIAGASSDPGASVANTWFGGTARGGSANRAFAGSVQYAALENCHWLEAEGEPMQGTEGATAIGQGARLSQASWDGYDFGGVWDMENGKTTPYFGWSLAGGNFRVFAQEEDGTRIALPGGGLAAPGTDAAVSAASETAEKVFSAWAGAADYADRGAAETTFLADNHRTVRCVWGQAIADAAGLAAIADNPAGTYVLVADIDLGGVEWTPICPDYYSPFTGRLHGNGHAILDLSVDAGDANNAGLFGCISNATVTGVRLVNPVVKGGRYVGALAGRATGSTVGDCFVEGAQVSAGGERAGVLFGQIDGGTTVTRCGALGDVEAAGQYAGGFAGVLDGESGGCAASECFAVGRVAAGGYAGGFAGWIGGKPAAISDCYAIANVRGGERVGGFVGHAKHGSTSFVRCYAAGGDTTGTTSAGGFAGSLENYNGLPVFEDCVRLADGHGDVGQTGHEGIAALDAAGMRAAKNFAAFRAAGVWEQEDGKTQPYFAWSLADGKMRLAVRPENGAGGDATGAGWFAPGTRADIAAVSGGGDFLAWIGSADYDDPSSAEATVLIDNFRTATARFGKLATTREELEAVADDPAGLWGLGADIDLGDADWTPLGNDAAPFTGAFHGRGNRITGLRIDTAADCAGLFGVVSNATLDGVALEGVLVCAGRYGGALAGDVRGASVLKGCSADGCVSNAGDYAGMLAGRIYGNGTWVENCSARGTVVSAANDTGGLVGGVYYAPASFSGCEADVDVVAAGGKYKGGFVGSVRDGNASATFADCVASGDVSAANSAQVGGFAGYVYKPVSCTDCRADGFVSGGSSVGGFAGQLSAAATVSNCAARGDVRSSSGSLGGFVGDLGHADALISDSWCSGAVWGGTGDSIGAFAGSCSQGTAENCGVLAAANGLRPFCGNNAGVTGEALTSAEAKALSRGWPKVRSRAESATVISTAEELRAVTNDLAGVYALAADIDLGGAAWTPIGNPSKPFTGEFYGNGHAISNFAVAAAAQGAGLFGSIDGGRVAGVRAVGTVSGGSAACIGGFAGKIIGHSHVADCSFKGAVSGAGQYLGGFAGQTYDSPVVVRCAAAGRVSQTNNADYAGGFVAYCNGGFVSDSHALENVSAGSGKYVGGFVGCLASGSARMGNGYCAGLVVSTGRFTGAFGGGIAGTGLVAGAYYDSGKNDGLLAQGQDGRTSADYEGIAPLSSAAMVHRASFPALDFAETWKIDEGETTPYLRLVAEEKSAYETWAEENGIAGGPEDETNGIANAIRYAFGIAPSLGPGDVPSQLDVGSDANGPFVGVAPLVNTEGVLLGVEATDDVCHWEGIHLVPMSCGSDGEWRPADGKAHDMLFGRYVLGIEQ